MNQPIKGYRVLSEEELALINEGKELGNAIQAWTEKVKREGADPRWVAIGITQLQQGMMAVTRGIAQPTNF